MNKKILCALTVFSLFFYFGCPSTQVNNQKNPNGSNDPSLPVTPILPVGIEPVYYYTPPDGPLGGGKLYDIGPGDYDNHLNTFREIQDFPWLSLAAGDLVRIHYREKPYNGIIGIKAHGTHDAPIRIYGVRDGVDNIPVLSGENAIIGSSFGGYFDEWTTGLGLIVICDTYRNKPTYIEIANLDIRNANPPYKFTHNLGNIYDWDRPCGIWLKAGNVSILGCRIHNNGEGILTQANDSDISGITSDFLIEGSAIYDNGIIGSDRQHNLYIQSAGMTVQFCKIGTLRPGAIGSALKDRSSGTVIRYNYIESGARVIDLVEPEDSEDVLLPLPEYNTTYIYGNIITNDFSDPDVAHSGSMIHYGYDNAPESSRNGTLYFYNNTVYMKASQEQSGRLNIFDISLNTADVRLYNNIFYREGDAYLNMLAGFGEVFSAGGNWISSGWFDIREGVPYQDPDPAVPRIVYGTVTQDIAFIEGDNPGFTNTVLNNFSLISGSPCINNAVTLTTVLPGFPVNYQYIKGIINSPRASNNNSGAIE